MNEHSLIYMTNLYENAMDMNTKLQEELENLKSTNEEHRYLNGKLREENKRLKEKLKFEEATNKELLSTGAELEKKLYEEQDKNKRLKKELQEEIEEKEHYQAIVESWE